MLYDHFHFAFLCALALMRVCWLTVTTSCTLFLSRWITDYFYSPTLIDQLFLVLWIDDRLLVILQMLHNYIRGMSYISNCDSLSGFSLGPGWHMIAGRLDAISCWDVIFCYALFPFSLINLLQRLIKSPLCAVLKKKKKTVTHWDKV